MRVGLLTLALVLFCGLPSFATNVSGLITTNTTWTKSNSPYLVTGNIDVDTNATLTIESGAVVKFDGNYVIYIDGLLKMQGTATDTITITSNSTNPVRGDYIGFDIRNSRYADTILFEYCHFQYGGYGVCARNIAAKIVNCIFDYCGEGVYNQNITRSYAYVNNCSFSHCGAGIYSYGTVIVDNSIFKHCVNWGFYVNNWNAANACSNSIFYANTNAIVKCTNVNHNVICFSDNQGLFWCNNVSYNEIFNNNIAVMSCNNIDHNSIEYNTTGVLNAYASYSIHSNCIAYNSAYNLTGVYEDVDVSGNYWGSPDSTHIADGILDFYDNFTSGRAVFTPFLQGADSGCATIQMPDTSSSPTGISTTGIESGSVRVYPNPVTGFLNIHANIGRVKEVSLYDLLGVEVLHLATSDKSLQIDLSQLLSGIYLYKIRMDNDHVITGKVIKE